MAEMTVADVLSKAADLIEPEGAWTQGAFSRNEDGSTDQDDDGNEIVAANPVCWCALGAIAEICGKDPAGDVYTLTSRSLPNTIRKLLNEQLGGRFVEDWNDDPDTTQAEVVAKLREAAALARETANG